MRPIDIDIHQVGGVTVIRPSGRLDSGRVDIFENAFSAEIDQGRHHVVIDCDHTEFIASSGLRVLLVARKRIDRHGGKMTMCNMKPHVRKLFETAGFDRMFAVMNSLDEAVARATPEGTAPPAAGGRTRRRQRTTARPGGDTGNASEVAAKMAAPARVRPAARGPRFDASGATAGRERGGLLHTLGKPWRVLKGLWTLVREA